MNDEPRADLPGEGGLHEQVTADHFHLNNGAVGVCHAVDAALTAGAAGFIEATDVTLARAGALLVLAGEHVSITQGAAVVTTAADDITLTQSGGSLLVAGEATVHDSFVGVLISRGATLQEGARVLLSMPQAAALGATLGIAFAATNYWLRRK